MHDRGPADLDARLLGNCAAFDGRMSEPLVDAGILVRGGRIATMAAMTGCSRKRNDIGPPGRASRSVQVRAKAS